VRGRKRKRLDRGKIWRAGEYAAGRSGNSVSDDRIRDLRIIRPRLYQLRYHRHVLEPTESPHNKIFGLFESAAKRAGELGGFAGAGPQLDSMTTSRLWLWPWPRIET
jgi:hypothetical protein